MKPERDRRADLFHQVARRGHRLTRPRRAVLEAIAESLEPFTVNELYGRLPADQADLVSVYRTVNLLLRLALLRETDSTRAGVRYELNETFTGHHHHLICRGCGRIEDLEGCLLTDEVLARVSQRVQRSRRFAVSEHEMRLFGRCRRCA